MRRTIGRDHLAIGTAIAAVLFLTAIVWHSIGEIHYLKSFFPSSFSVEAARDAAIVELVKVALIAMPLAFLVALGFMIRTR